MILLDERWLKVKDGDPRVIGMYRRHYSAKKNRQPKQRQCVGPGEPMVLLSPDCGAVFIWRKFIDDSGQDGVNCAVFRREGGVLASDLIREADTIAWGKWPGERHYTYVDPEEITSSLPGACFLFAGWRYVREKGHRVRTKSGLFVLERKAA